MEINGKDIDLYSAKLLKGFTIGSSELESSYFQGVNRTNVNLLKQVVKPRPISFGMMFSGDDREKIAFNKTLLDKELIGIVEIYLDNDYWYRCVFTSLGELEYDGKKHARAYYEAVGIQHNAIVTVKSSTFSCSSTVPFTDCIISGTTTGTSGSIGDITFSDVIADQAIVIDGINCRFLYQGAPAAQYFAWVNFPSLTPGVNTIVTTGLTDVEIQYYPTFI